MHATLRRLKCMPGRAEEVAELIESEYLPLLSQIAGVISYTLVHIGDDEITSLGMFTSHESAVQANALAKTLSAKHHLQDLSREPLDLITGEVMTHFAFFS
jgi:hypothetical protein